MRFLADMGISLATVRHLRDQGHDATHLTEDGLQRLPDHDVLTKARDEARVVLTSDLDFGYLLASSGEHIPSVILFRLSNMRPENVNRHLLAALEQLSDDADSAFFATVTDSALRVRRLPMSDGVD